MFKTVCTLCDKEADIMSFKKIAENMIEVTYVCPYCGNSKEEIHYLYIQEVENMKITKLIKYLQDLVNEFGEDLEVETFSDELYVEDENGNEIDTFNI